ncbi:MAG: diadenylate cyclase CdaA [Eubacteriales bacterium]|nr:diadenylate cyclase CdaA [Eubacteriales bacterium]
MGGLKLAESNFFQQLLEEFRSGFLLISGPGDFILMVADIFFTSVLIYYVLRLMSETRAWQVLKGLLTIVLLTQLAKVVGLQGFSFLVGSTISLLTFALIIIFQPEFRKALETVGRNSFTFLQPNVLDHQEYSKQVQGMIEQIVIACEHMASSFTGALIVLERRTRLGEILEQGQSVILNSNLSSTLLEQIFYKNSPLHDGALLVRNGKIYAARCHVPLSENFVLRKEHGTRHRAAIGASEIGDAIGVVVSEERGVISIAIAGRLYNLENGDALRTILHKLLIVDENLDRHFSLKTYWQQCRENLLAKIHPNRAIQTQDEASSVLIPEVDNSQSKSRSKRRTHLLRITSVSIAFCLWFYAQISTNPIRSKSFTTNLHIVNLDVLEDYHLEYSKEYLSNITLVLRGRDRLLSSLSPEQISTYIDFKDIQKSQLEAASQGQEDPNRTINLEVHVEINNMSPKQYQIFARNPGVVKINLYRNEEGNHGILENPNDNLPEVPENFEDK